jgi:transmembrane sensor
MNAPSKIDSFSKEAQPTLEAVEHAAEWHVRLHASEAGESDRAAFEAWLSQHPDNDEAYRRLEALWGKFDEVEPVPALSALESALRSNSKTIRRKLPAKSLMLGLSLVTAVWLGAQTETVGYLMSDYSTAVGEQRVIELSDHSRITLNTYSAIDVNISGKERHITLHKGEILVEVAKDATRPFIVETAQGTARALGTKFVVKREGSATAVSVVESVVEACTVKPHWDSTEKKCVRLHAGQGTNMAAKTVEPPMPINIDDVAGWSSGMLAIDNRPLSEVLQELERYRIGRIHVDPEVADLRVSGVFPLDDTDRALDVLAGILPIRAQNYTPLLTIVKAQ